MRVLPVVTVSGWSKSYAMTGDRLGYATGPREVISAIESVQGLGSYPAAAAQYPVLAAYSDGLAFPNALAAFYAANWRVVRSRLPELAACGLELLVEPRGGLFVFLDVGALARRLPVVFGVAPGDRVERWLLDVARVGVSSGASYCDRSAVRISLSVERVDLEQAVDRILSAAFALPYRGESL